MSAEHGEVGPRRLTVLTWNLLGRARPDLGAAAAGLAELDADVLLLQEVQRAQARALAHRLDLAVAWRFKHWPVRAAAEGHAILSRRGLHRVRAHRLSDVAWPWAWQRRIAIVAEVEAGVGVPVTVVDTHLSAAPGEGGATEREAQGARLLALLADRPAPVIVAGDLNARPGEPPLSSLAAAGFRDAWEDRHPGVPVATNWDGGGDRTRPPDQRLDWLLVDAGLAVVAASVPDAREGWSTWSDHLPVVATVEVS